MMLQSLLLSLSLLCSALSVFAYSSPPSGAITVGKGGKYSTLTQALADQSGTVFFVYPGTYKEQVVINRSGIKIYGSTNTSNSYTGNTVTFTNNKDATSAGSDAASGTVRVTAASVSLYNINIANTYGHPVTQSQAIALSVEATKFAAYGLRITGYQDTLLANTGFQFYSNCWIEGAVDFIFGMQASVWITKSVLNTVGSGYITASGRSTDDSNYYVIDQSTIKGTGTTYLGRPWRDYARVIFQKSTLGSNVVAAGWASWSSSDPRTDHVTFAEYSNTGAGASGTRASFSKKLSSAVTVTTVLGSTSWIESSWI